MQMTQHYLPVHKKESGNFSNIWYKISARYNMYINAQKSKTKVISKQDNVSVQVDHEGESLEQVHDFKFLGSYKSADGDCTKEIKRRIALARQKAVVLATIWKDRNIKTATNESQSDEVNGVGSIPVWSGGMDFEEIGQKQNRSF